MDTIDYILEKFNIECDDSTRMPIEIPNFGRNQLAVLFNELGFKLGVEVGVRDGEYSEVLCNAIPGVGLAGVDPYIRIKGYRDITKQETFNKYRQEAMKRLAPYPNYRFLEVTSAEAVRHFPDQSLDFVYIDGNHDFYNTTFDIHHWLPKLRKGGIIAGHDFVKRKNEAAHVHVKQVLTGYTDAYNISPWFVLGTDAKVEGEVRDDPRSWMWVKQ